MKRNSLRTLVVESILALTLIGCGSADSLDYKLVVPEDVPTPIVMADDKRLAEDPNIMMT